MKTVQMTSLYKEWGEPFGEGKVKKMESDLKEMFGYGISLMVDENADGFTIRIMKESEQRLDSYKYGT